MERAIVQNSSHMILLTFYCQRLRSKLTLPLVSPPTVPRSGVAASRPFLAVTLIDTSLSPQFECCRGQPCPGRGPSHDCCADTFKSPRPSQQHTKRMPLMSTSHSAGRLCQFPSNPPKAIQHSQTMQSNVSYHSLMINQFTTTNNPIFSNPSQPSNQMPSKHQMNGFSNVSRGGPSNGLSSQTMYTSPENLQQTIWLQQQLFHQAMQKNNTSQALGFSQKPGVHCFQKVQPECCAENPPGSSSKGQPSCSLQRSVSCNQTTGCRSEPTTPADQRQMEWKVRVKWFFFTDRTDRITNLNVIVTLSHSWLSQLLVDIFP